MLPRALVSRGIMMDRMAGFRSDVIKSSLVEVKGLDEMT
jgi:hypothetical protein